MQARATLKNAKMSPRKMRPLARLLRGMTVADAKAQLAFMPGKASELILDVLASAAANATNNLGMSLPQLVVREVQVSKGIVLKRFNPVAKGMAHPILKRFANVTVVVETKADGKDKKTIKKAAKRKAIPTLSMDEFAASEMKVKTQEAQEIADQKAKTALTPDKALARPEPTAKERASRKIITNQLGGDKKKTHRRKSIG